MQSTVVASANQVSSEVGDEVVIMDLASGVYHGLDSVGARAWSLIQQPARVDAVRDQLLAEYEVDRPRCEADLLALLGQLKDKALIDCLPTARMRPVRVYCLRGRRMNREQLRRFAALPPIRRCELFRAVAVLTAARLALWVLPFRAVRVLLSKLTSANGARENMAEIETTASVAWAVGVAARVVPASTCLVQAMATQAILGRKGIQSTLRLGVTRAGGEFRAHAWIESRGRVVIGGRESPSVYSMLPTPQDGDWLLRGGAVR